MTQPVAQPSWLEAESSAPVQDDPGVRRQCDEKGQDRSVPCCEVIRDTECVQVSGRGVGEWCAVPIGGNVGEARVLIIPDPETLRQRVHEAWGRVAGELTQERVVAVEAQGRGRKELASPFAEVTRQHRQIESHELRPCCATSRAL